MNSLFRSLLVPLAIVLAGFSSSAQWVKTASSPLGSGITDLVVKQSNGYLFATTGSFDWPNADTGGVHRSTDGGNTWTRVFRAYVARLVEVHPDGRIFASVWDFPAENEGLYYSTDDGDSWIQAYDGPPNNNIFCFAIDPANPLRMFAGMRDALIYSNGGGMPGTWSIITPVTFGVWAMQVAIQEPYFGINGRVFLLIRNSTTFATSVYYSDGPPGMGWNLISGTSPGDTLISMSLLRDSTYFGYESQGLYVGTTNGKIYKSHLIGTPPLSLMYQADGAPTINAFCNIDFTTALDNPAAPGPGTRKNYSASEDDDDDGPSNSGSAGGIHKSIDHGQTWEVVNDGLPGTNLRMSSVAAHVTSGVTATLYAGLFLNQNDGGPMYSYEVVTGVGSGPPVFPGKFGLDQNHPNPFNPQTEIGYRVPEAGHVNLTVYDLLGRAISTLVNEKKSPGSHTTTWDGTGQPSGVYFYRLSTNDFVQTRKLVLLR